MTLLIPFKKYTLDDIPTQPVNVSLLRQTTRILIVDESHLITRRLSELLDLI